MNNTLRNIVLPGLTALLLLLAAGRPAWAANVITQAFISQVDFAAPANPFGVVLGSRFSNQANYDLSLLGIVPTLQSPASDPALTFVITLGTLSLNAGDDDFYPTFPKLLLDSVNGMQDESFVVSFDFPKANTGPQSPSSGRYFYVANLNRFSIIDTQDGVEVVAGSLTLPNPAFTPGMPRSTPGFVSPLLLD